MKRKDNPVSEEFDYYEDFVKALVNTKGDYIAFEPFYTDATKIKNSKDPRVVYAERIFAYEFYHQYRRIMDDYDEKYGDESKYHDIQLNGEQIKDAVEFTAIKDGLSTFSPDLILHGSLSNTEKHYWICEIKMNHNPYPFEDLFKIGLYKTNKVNFKNYIFLYVGESDNLMKEGIEKMVDYIKKVKSEKKRKYKKLVDDTICIFYNPSTSDDDKKVQSQWLCNILINHGVELADE